MLKRTLLFITALFILTSCSKEDGIITPEKQGTVSFAFSNGQLNTSAKTTNDYVPTAIKIVINDITGDQVINETLTLLTFGDSYITDEIELPQGDYTITSFNIIDTDNIVLYASPLEGAEFAEYVNDPLPILFSVTGNETNIVSPEVIFVGPTTTPEQFGYTSFSYTVVEIPTSQDGLHLAVHSIINGDNVGLLEGATYNFNIPDNSNEFTSYGDIPNGQTFVEVTNLSYYENHNIDLTVSHPDYDTQNFTLDIEELVNYTDENPFKVTFEQTQTDSETQKIYVSLTLDGDHTTGYYYAHSFWENSIDFQVTEIEIPVIADGETLTIEFGGQSGIDNIILELTNEDIEIYKIDNTPLVVNFTSEVDTQEIYVELRQDTENGEYVSGNYYLTYYNYETEGLLPYFSVQQMKIPVIKDGETVSITFENTSNTLYHDVTIEIPFEEIENYNDDSTPLTVVFWAN